LEIVDLVGADKTWAPRDLCRNITRT